MVDNPEPSEAPQEQKSEENSVLGLHKAIRRRLCLKDMIEAMQTEGPWTINRTFFAKKYGFHPETVCKWYENLSKGIKISGAIEIRNRSIDSLCHHIGVCEKIINNPDTKPFMKLKTIEREESLLKTLNAFLEAYGIKEKVPEKHEVITASLDLNRVLEIMKAKAERIKKAQEAAR